MRAGELGKGGKGVERFGLEVLDVVHIREVVASVIQGSLAFVVARVMRMRGGGIAMVFADAVAGGVCWRGGRRKGVVGDFDGNVVLRGG